MLPASSHQRINRRQFLARSSASALALPVLGTHVLTGATPQPKLRFALIGCGGRGRWIGKLFLRHGGYECTAVHDYFPDRAEAAANDLGVPASARFTGLNGYRQALDQKVDAAIIISPPYFHPEQMAAAVAAGQHVYLAKPLAVDVPGCLTIADLSHQATQNKLAVLVDFQTRAMPDYQTAVAHVHNGMIGRIGLAEATYHCGNTFDSANQALQADPANPELRMRAWGLDAVLSGDVITEQNIHALDVASWILNTEPIKAAMIPGPSSSITPTTSSAALTQNSSATATTTSSVGSTAPTERLRPTTAAASRSAPATTVSKATPPTSTNRER